MEHSLKRTHTRHVGSLSSWQSTPYHLRLHWLSKAKPSETHNVLQLQVFVHHALGMTSASTAVGMQPWA